MKMKAVLAIGVVLAVVTLAVLGAYGRPWWERNYMVPPGIVRAGSYESPHHRLTGDFVNRYTNTWSSLGNAMGPYSSGDKRAAGRAVSEIMGFSRGTCYAMNYENWELVINH